MSLKPHIRYIKVPLTFELPNRNWIKGENGLWSSIEWTQAERKVAEAARYKWRRA